MVPCLYHYLRLEWPLQQGWLKPQHTGRRAGEGFCWEEPFSLFRSRISYLNYWKRYFSFCKVELIMWAHIQSWGCSPSGDGVWCPDVWCPDNGLTSSSNCCKHGRGCSMGQEEMALSCSVWMFVFPRCVVVTTYFAANCTLHRVDKRERNGDGEKERWKYGHCILSQSFMTGFLYSH